MVGTVNHLYESYSAINHFWTNTPNQQRMKIAAQLLGHVLIMQKSYDTSASAEAWRTHDLRVKTNLPKKFEDDFIYRLLFAILFGSCNYR